MSALDAADCTDETCPRSGKPIRAGALTGYGGEAARLRNPGCRGRRASALHHFEPAKGPPGRGTAS